MLSMQLSKRFVQQIVLDGFAFVGILNNLLDCYKSGEWRQENGAYHRIEPVGFKNIHS